MRRRLIPIISLVMCCATCASAQSANDLPYPTVEVFAAYSSLATTYTDFQFGSNVRVENGDFGTKTGFESSVLFNRNDHLAIKADFSAHFKRISCSCVFAPSSTPQSYEVKPKLFNFLLGPEFKLRNRTKFVPFTYGLLGLAHTETSFSTPVGTLTKSQTGFGLAVGGGLDIRIAPKVTLRYALDYNPTFVGIGDTGTHQLVHGVRWSAGGLFGIR